MQNMSALQCGTEVMDTSNPTVFLRFISGLQLSLFDNDSEQEKKRS